MLVQNIKYAYKHIRTGRTAKKDVHLFFQQQLRNGSALLDESAQ